MAESAVLSNKRTKLWHSVSQFDEPQQSASFDPQTVDDIRVGAAIRLARIRRGWRQGDLARAANRSATTISRIERGRLDGIPLVTIRAVAGALDIRVELLPRSRNGDVDRMLNARHAALADAVAAWLRGFDAWETRPEVSFSWFGERGVVDVLAWNAERRALLQVEVKTEIVDSGELLATLDRRRRLGRQIAEPLDWAPEVVSTLLVVAESETNRRRVRALDATFAAALPDRIVAVRRYLSQPATALRGLMFFSDSHHRHASVRFAARRRVRLPRTGPSGDERSLQGELVLESGRSILR